LKESKSIISFLIFALSGATPAWAQLKALGTDQKATDRTCIRWDVPQDQEINKRQAERLYREALHWVEEHVAQRKGADRPCITVIVGKPCSDLNIKGPCANPVTGEIDIPKWESTSPGAIAQGAISTMLLHLLDAKEITRAAKNLLAKMAATTSISSQRASLNKGKVENYGKNSCIG